MQSTCIKTLVNFFGNPKKIYDQGRAQRCAGKNANSNVKQSHNTDLLRQQARPPLPPLVAAKPSVRTLVLGAAQRNASS